ncbi:hypothetical protein PT2222_330083 [Paraburkholderia tropica]
MQDRMIGGYAGQQLYPGASQQEAMSNRIQQIQQIQTSAPRPTTVTGYLECAHSGLDALFAAMAEFEKRLDGVLDPQNNGAGTAGAPQESTEPYAVASARGVAYRIEQAATALRILSSRLVI